MKFILTILFLGPLFAFSQDVIVNGYDKFLKQQRIEMAALPIVSSADTKLNLSFTAISSTFYLEMSGWGWGASTIDADNKAIFLFSNDSTITVTSTGLQSFESGEAQARYKHQYLVTARDLEALSRYELIGIRKYSFKEFTDIRIPRDSGPKIKKLSAVFAATYKKSLTNKSSALVQPAGAPATVVTAPAKPAVPVIASTRRKKAL